MTGAVPAAEPAATTAPGNATLLSAQPDPAPDTPPPPGEPKDPPEPGPETDPVEPEKEGDPPEGTEPEAYTFTAPEGVTLDPAAVEAFTPVAKDMKLSQEQAQRLVAVYADIQQRQAEAHAAQVAEWGKAVVADKEIGGPKMIENVEAANALLRRFGTPELDAVLKSTGLGNHPEMVRVLARVGKEFSDDRHATGGGQPSQPLDFATEYYAKMPKRERVS